MTLKEFYTCIGGSYEAMMNRFGDENRIKRYLKMFKEDETYKALMDAVLVNDYEVAFRSIHTMKGLSANLAFDALYKAAVDLTEILRHYNGVSFDNELLAVRREYEKIIEFLEKID